MTTRLVIARHGNTFDKGDVIRRVGARTDLPLSVSGEEQAATLGRHWREESLLPDVLLTSMLRRTRQTAMIAMQSAECDIAAQPLAQFNEVDYGPDDGQPEDSVIARLGAQALADWEERAVVPSDWLADPAAITAMWRAFLVDCAHRYAGKTVAVVTSNGIARFVLPLLPPMQHNPKLATACYGLLTHDGGEWSLQGWNIRPTRPMSSTVQSE